MMRLALPLLALLSVSACTTKYIGNSRVEDTAENRDVLRVVEQYRRAMDDKDVQRILELTSDDFFEDPGTPGDPSDDYDKIGLRTRLEATFAKVEEQRLRIDVRRITFADDDKRAFVEYRYDLRYRLNLPNATEWRDATDLSRLSMKRQDGTWKITGGL